MKIRESGMPNELYWESFFDVSNIFSKLELIPSVKDVVEFGSGYGTFTIPASKIIKGNIYAFDIDNSMINRLKERSAKENITNIKILHKDFIKDKTGLKDNSVDYVMLFNILHAEDPISLFEESYRILKYKGKLAIIHWIYSEITPRGPSLNIRPKPEDCTQWMKSAGFSLAKPVLSLPPYHYGILGLKE